MSFPLRRIGLWALITATIFFVFWWLFRLGLPGAALQFAAGITIILVGGLLFGRFISRLWIKTSRQTYNTVLLVLLLLVLVSCFGIGWLVNKMIGNTQFIHFFFTCVLLFLVSGFIAMFISLVRYRIKANIQSARTELAQTKSELQALQSQLSPHFLFNTLNNLYGLSISDHKKVPNLILKLSDLLRYSVYEAKEPFVPLQDEVEYIRNYIEFEKIRLGERLQLKLHLEPVADKSIKIAPMLLIVFIENAFKHSKNNQHETIFIEIELKATADAVRFFAHNSCGKQGTTSALAEKHSGFGLESVRKRLKLLYGNKHELKIQRTDQSYTVNLILYANENQVPDYR
jgi:sensor histidine kinase YesM